MSEIKFGTDGWRAVIADQYTLENLKRVADATAKWLLKYHQNPTIVIGHDTRFGGKLFAETTARVMGAHNIKVHLAETFVSTPMISLATHKLKANAGVIITASHNPPSYNGYKIKAYYGGPALPDMISEVEDLISTEYTSELPELKSMEEKGKLVYHDIEKMYCDHAAASFDLDAIRKSKIRIAFDPMYGSAQTVMDKLLPETICVRNDENPSFKGVAPEPIMKNLGDFSRMIKKDGKFDFGLATDGDGDRIGLLDGKGEFIDSHHIILMLINYLYVHKKQEGSVVSSFSCTRKISKMCEHYNIEHKVTKIGFKYICEHILKSKVMVGGEESGGIAVSTHIPERDGIWIGLTLLEYMAKANKSLHDLIKEVYSIVGPFAVDRNDLHIDEVLKQSIMEKCKANTFKSFGKYNIQNVEQIDGFKYIIDNDRWVMIRPSGTEPVLRIYAEAPDKAEVQSILDACKKEITKI